MYIDIALARFCDYSVHFKGYANDTIKRYRKTVELYSRFAGIERTEEIHLDSLRAFFFYGRTERKWSSGTFISHHNSLIVFFRWCVREGFMQTNPVDEIEVPRLEKRLPPKLTKQDTLRLLEIVYNYPWASTFIRHRNYAIFSMFVFAGLRRRELLKLKLADVDIENLTIFIRQGKGNKDRIVPMNFALAEALKRYLKERARLRKTCPEFFTSYTYNIGFTSHGMKWVINNLQKVMSEKFGVHMLRHTFATLMLEGGCDIYSLSRMMGHSDIKTTTIYLSASADHLRFQISKHPLNGMMNHAR